MDKNLGWKSFRSPRSLVVVAGMKMSMTTQNRQKSNAKKKGKLGDIVLNAIFHGSQQNGRVINIRPSLTTEPFSLL